MEGGNRMKSKILVVDDEPDIRELLRFYLEKEGYKMLEASNGKQALQVFENDYVDLAVVDVMMPVMDGWELVKSMKEIRDVPVIMLTAKGESKDKLKGFDLGIDDYVTKPCDMDELMARIRTIMKRYSINSQNIIQIGDVTFDGDTCEIIYQEKVIHLPLKQFELVFELAKKPNHIFSREQLIERIWGIDYDGFDRTVDVHIKRIRENLGYIPDFKVETVRGLGYKLEVKK